MNLFFFLHSKISLQNFFLFCLDRSFIRVGSSVSFRPEFKTPFHLPVERPANYPPLHHPRLHNATKLYVEEMPPLVPRSPRGQHSRVELSFRENQETLLPSLLRCENGCHYLMVYRGYNTPQRILLLINFLPSALPPFSL